MDYPSNRFSGDFSMGFLLADCEEQVFHKVHHQARVKLERERKQLHLSVCGAVHRGHWHCRPGSFQFHLPLSFFEGKRPPARALPRERAPFLILTTQAAPRRYVSWIGLPSLLWPWLTHFGEEEGTDSGCGSCLVMIYFIIYFL